MFSIAFSQNGKRLNYHFSNLTPSDGLASGRVLFITQDSQGYIWIYSVFNGLQRYDGVRFQSFGDQFLNKQTNTYEIQELNFFEGHLYLQIAERTYAFDTIRQKFVQVDFRDNSEKTTYIEDNGNVWKTGKHSLVIQDPKGSVIYKRLFLHDGIRSTLSLIYDSARRNHWFAKDTDLFFLDGTTRKVYSLKDSHKHPLFDILNKKGRLEISNMMLDNKDNFWISTWGSHLFRFNLSTNQFQEYSLSGILEKEAPNTRKDPLGVNNFLLDNHNQFWVSTYGTGLLKYNYEANRFDYLITEKGNPFSLQYNYELFALVQDRQDNLWVGTDKGISIFNPYKDYFLTLQNESGNSLSMPASEIISAFQSSTKELWVGTWGGGIAVYDSNFLFNRNHRFGSGLADMVWSFAEDKKGRIWAGGQSGWIHRFNSAEKKFDAPFRILNSVSTITCETSDTNGNIYFGYQNGSIAKWDALKDSFYLYPHRVMYGTKAVPVQFMVADQNQNIRVTNGQYIYKFDSKKLKYTDSISLFTESPQASHIDLPSYINLHSSFSIVNDSILLVSSLGGKPGYINLLTRKFEELKIPEEVVRKRITSIEGDANGRIWVTADRKLYQFIPGTVPRLVDYDFGPGIINGPFSQHKMLPLQNGRKAIWTTSEVVIFDPKQLNPPGDNLVIATPTITGFKVFDRYILLDSFVNKFQHIPLSYNQNFITIEFAPLIYLPVIREKYYYKLSGINEEWVEADNNFSASYANLSPGSYVFSVKSEGASAQNGIVSLRIIVTPPFYQTWWFYVACIASIGFMIYLIIRRRIAQVRKQGILKHKMVETEMAALRAQMNPHFIFNCISAIDSLIQSGERDQATNYLARFARLIRNVLESSKNNLISFHKDLETIKLFIEMEQLRSSNKFDYEIHVDPELINGDYKVPPMLLQPFIENAIHHGLRNKMSGKKHLYVSAQLGARDIVYIVSDTGVGRGMAESLRKINKPDHVSYGIGISRERLSMYNNQQGENDRRDNEENLVINDLYDGEGLPTGTEVIIKLNISSIS